MNISIAEKILFDEWSEKRPRLVSDGVVDEEAYLHSEQKLLFVLKEVNDPEPDAGGWDLREYIREGGRPKTWDNITRWVEGIRRLPEDIGWMELEKISEEKRQLTLRSIAAVNLKKSPGGHTTDSSTLKKIAKEDKIFLHKQFSLYNPDLIICCGTIDLFHQINPLDVTSEKKTTRRGVSFYEYAQGKFIIDFAHPEARCKDQFLYYGLVDALREILFTSSHRG